MKRWETPKTVVQEFEANEYVAACWGVACSTGNANAYEIEHGYYNNGTVSHSPDHCGTAANQWIYTGDDNIADGMTELNTAGLGDLGCVLYTDNTYHWRGNYADVRPGQTIYWTTGAEDGRVWHHQGTVYASYDGHPNRS